MTREVICTPEVNKFTVKLPLAKSSALGVYLHAIVSQYASAATDLYQDQDSTRQTHCDVLVFQVPASEFNVVQKKLKEVFLSDYEESVLIEEVEDQVIIKIYEDKLLDKYTRESEEGIKTYAVAKVKQFLSDTFPQYSASLETLAKIKRDAIYQHANIIATSIIQDTYKRAEIGSYPSFQQAEVQCSAEGINIKIDMILDIAYMNLVGLNTRLEVTWSYFISNTGEITLAPFELGVTQLLSKIEVGKEQIKRDYNEKIKGSEKSQQGDVLRIREKTRALPFSTLHTTDDGIQILNSPFRNLIFTTNDQKAKAVLEDDESLISLEVQEFSMICEAFETKLSASEVMQTAMDFQKCFISIWLLYHQGHMRDLAWKRIEPDASISISENLQAIKKGVLPQENSNGQPLAKETLAVLKKVLSSGILEVEDHQSVIDVLRYVFKFILELQNAELITSAEWEDMKPLLAVLKKVLSSGILEVEDHQSMIDVLRYGFKFILELQNKELITSAEWEDMKPSLLKLPEYQRKEIQLEDNQVLSRIAEVYLNAQQQQKKDDFLIDLSRGKYKLEVHQNLVENLLHNPEYSWVNDSKYSVLVNGYYIIDFTALYEDDEKKASLITFVASLPPEVKQACKEHFSQANEHVVKPQLLYQRNPYEVFAEQSLHTVRVNDDGSIERLLAPIVYTRVSIPGMPRESSCNEFLSIQSEEAIQFLPHKTRSNELPPYLSIDLSTGQIVVHGQDFDVDPNYIVLNGIKNALIQVINLDRARYKFLVKSAEGTSPAEEEVADQSFINGPSDENALYQKLLSSVGQAISNFESSEANKRDLASVFVYVDALDKFAYLTNRTIIDTAEIDTAKLNFFRVILKLCENYINNNEDFNQNLYLPAIVDSAVALMQKGFITDTIKLLAQIYSEFTKIDGLCAKLGLEKEDDLIRYIEESKQAAAANIVEFIQSELPDCPQTIVDLTSEQQNLIIQASNLALNTLSKDAKLEDAKQKAARRSALSSIYTDIDITIDAKNYNLLSPQWEENGAKFIFRQVISSRQVDSLDLSNMALIVEGDAGKSYSKAPIQKPFIEIIPKIVEEQNIVSEIQLVRYSKNFGLDTQALVERIAINAIALTFISSFDHTLQLDNTNQGIFAQLLEAKKLLDLVDAVHVATEGALGNFFNDDNNSMSLATVLALVKLVDTLLSILQKDTNEYSNEIKLLNNLRQTSRYQFISACHELFIGAQKKYPAHNRAITLLDEIKYKDLTHLSAYINWFATHSTDESINQLITNVKNTTNSFEEPPKIPNSIRFMHLTPLQYSDDACTVASIMSKKIRAQQLKTEKNISNSGRNSAPNPKPADAFEPILDLISHVDNVSQKIISSLFSCRKFNRDIEKILKLNSSSLLPSDTLKKLEDLQNASYVLKEEGISIRTKNGVEYSFEEFFGPSSQSKNKADILLEKIKNIIHTEASYIPKQREVISNILAYATDSQLASADDPNCVINMLNPLRAKVISSINDCFKTSLLSNTIKPEYKSIENILIFVKITLKKAGNDADALKKAFAEINNKLTLKNIYELDSVYQPEEPISHPALTAISAFVPSAVLAKIMHTKLFSFLEEFLYFL